MDSPAKLKWVYALMVVFIGMSSRQVRRLRVNRCEPQSFF
mgnify:CR=1 FL=1|jgi:hypothetical protein